MPILDISDRATGAYSSWSDARDDLRNDDGSVEIDPHGDRIENTRESSSDTLSSIGERDALGALDGLGRTQMNLIHGDADDYISDYEDQNPQVDEYRDRIQSGLDEGGLFGYGSATNELLKTGGDAIFDSPQGFNLQETTTGGYESITGVDQEGLADQSQSAYDRWMDGRSTIGDQQTSAAERITSGTRFEGGNFETLMSRGPGTAFDWFLQYPAEATFTAGTGIDASEGRTDARAEPIDLVDVAFFGPLASLRGASRAGRSLSSGSSSGLLAGASSFATDFSSNMVRGISNVGRSLRNLGGSSPSPRSTPSGGTPEAPSSPGPQREIGSPDTAAPSSPDTPSPSTPDTPSPSTPDYQGANEGSQLFGFSASDAPTPSTPSPSSGVPDSVITGGLGVRSAREIPGAATQPFRDLSGRITNTLSGFRRSSTPSTPSTPSSGLPDNVVTGGLGVRSVREIPGAAVDGVRNTVGRITNRLGNLRSPSSPGARSPSSPSSPDDLANAARTRLDDAAARVRPGGRTPSSPDGNIFSRAWGSLGTPGRLVAGGIATLTGGAIATDIAGIDFGEMLSGGDPEDQPEDGLPSADGLTGSIDAPSEIVIGEGFTASWTVSRDGVDESAGRILLGVDIGGEVEPLVYDQYTLGPNRTADEGNFEVQSQARLEEGEKELVGYVSSNDGIEGQIDSTTVNVVGPDDASDDGWGDPEPVDDWPMGWTLYAQPRLDGPDEVRYLVGSTNDDGDNIYIHPDGRARTDAHTYATGEEAAVAFERWAERNESGSTSEEEVPSDGAGRANTQQMQQDAQQANQGPQGALNRVRSYARNNPVQFAGISLVTAAVGYYLYREGHLDKPIETIQRVNPL